MLDGSTYLQQAPTLSFSAGASAATASILPPAHEGPFRAALDAHHGRVGEMARRLARRLGLDPAQAHRVGAAAARHDIGKLLLDSAIFEVPRRLTEDEMTHVRAHTLLGHAALAQSSDPERELAARVALEHHEHWDGGGYPFGLWGEAICVEARIVTLCDVYDALRDARGYKRGYTHREAMTVLTRGDDRTGPTMFDPRILSVVAQDQGRLLDEVVREATQRAAAAA